MAGEVKFDCRRCARNSKLKADNGCEKETKIPVFEMDCIRCAGTDKNCPVCHGTNKEAFYRCPLKFLTMDIVRFMRFYRFSKQGFLPAGGGLLDQTALFVEAIEIVDKEVAEAQKYGGN